MDSGATIPVCQCNFSVGGGECWWHSSQQCCIPNIFINCLSKRFKTYPAVLLIVYTVHHHRTGDLLISSSLMEQYNSDFKHTSNRKSSKCFAYGWGISDWLLDHTLSCIANNRALNYSIDFHLHLLLYGVFDLCYSFSVLVYWWPLCTIIDMHLIDM